MSPRGVPGGRERVERERQEAYERYHEVFAALDRLVNESLASGGQKYARHDRLAAFQSVLVQFLQQITPYVDSRMRVLDQQVADIEMTAAAAQRTAAAAQRAWESVRNVRTPDGPAGTPDSGPRTHSGPRTEDPGLRTPSGPRTEDPGLRTMSIPSLPHHASAEEAAYVGFEDLFRGDEATIRARQADYVPLFAGASDVLDVGCGRGEFLSLLQEAGIAARGIDLNEEMVAACRSRGLSAERADAVDYLAEMRPDSLGGLFSAQVVEHLEPPRLFAFLREASRVLKPGARLVLETINPACWVAFFESYIRDLTHARPLHPETLKYLVVANGFGEVEVRFRSPIPEDARLRRLPALPDPSADASPEGRVLWQLVAAFNLNMERLNDRLFTHLDYAVLGRRV